MITVSLKEKNYCYNNYHFLTFITVTNSINNCYNYEEGLQANFKN